MLHRYSFKQILDRGEGIMKEILGSHGKYWIYEDGRVYNKVRDVFVTPIISKKGWPVVPLELPHGVYTYLLITLMADHYIPKISGYAGYKYKDGNPLNNHFSNIERTLSRIRAKPFRGGFIRKGSKNPMSKLTESQVAEIKHLSRNTDTLQKDIAKKFGISTATVSSIKTGRARGAY
jgi:DNA-binding XRE family transcriptional regulator